MLWPSAATMSAPCAPGGSSSPSDTISVTTAIRTAPPYQIEALDMARKTLHDEGAAELQKRLEAKVETDFDTARRLFTLLCVLQMRG